MIDFLGWLGSIFLAICGAPEAWISFKRGRSELSWGFLLLWYFGEIFVLIPVLLEIQAPYLILNYGLNVLFISIIIYYKLRPRDEI